MKVQPHTRHQTAARTFQGIPGIERTPGGRYWATWYAGGVTEGPENFCVLVTSADDGLTWTEPVAVIDPPGKTRAFDPVIWIDPEERLWFFWNQSVSPKDGVIFDGVAGVWGMWTADIESESPSWSEPVRIANGIMMNKPTVLSNGEWAMPTAVWNNLGGGEVPAELQHERFSNITISDDTGQTFVRRGAADVPERHYDEHMIVERHDGSLMMWARTAYGIGQSFSFDGGVTWTPGKPSGIQGPNSRFFIRRLRSGRLLLVHHDMAGLPAGSGTRRALTAWFSEDDGASWVGGLLLDEREGVSYPDGIEDDTGRITIIYDYARYDEGAICLARFNEAEVLEGQLLAPDSFQKRCINRTGGVPKH